MSWPAIETLAERPDAIEDLLVQDAHVPVRLFELLSHLLAEIVERAFAIAKVSGRQNRFALASAACTSPKLRNTTAC